MAELIYPTNEILYGPWLIEHQHLEAFDEILAQEWSRLTASKQRKETEETEREIDRFIKLNPWLEKDPEKLRTKAKELIEGRSHLYKTYSSRLKRVISVYLKDGKRIEVDSFQEAARHPELLEEVPHKFDLRLECGEIDCSMSLTNSFLSIRVSPENLPEARDLFVSVKQWTARVRPPKWLEVWKRVNGLQWLAWILIVCIIVLNATGPKDEAKKVYQNQAHQLLKDGLSPEEQLKATEISLALQSEYTPLGDNSKTPGWFLFLLVGGLGICIISSIIPGAVLGIGKGQNRVRFWRKWIWFVFAAIPGFIFINIIWPYIARVF